MELSRRGFLKGIGGIFGAGMAYELVSATSALAVESPKEFKLEGTQEYTNICCYCSGGCGTLCSVRDGELINLEGDPDHPVNQGGLCPKGAAMFQLRNVVDPETREIVKNPDRITKPMIRRPGASEWETVSWDQIVEEIARKVKDTRDETFVEKNDDGLTVNFTPAMASLGGSQENGEEQYLILKMMRSLGIIAIDNQARVCHSSTVVGLAPTFGRGSMTSHYDDIRNADYILHCGSNSTESHPVSSRWLHVAHDRGAKWIVVDPRYTRTAEQADIYCPIRSGTDIAFYGGMYNYIFENLIEPGLADYTKTGKNPDNYNFEYLLNYTNASYLMDPEYSFDPETGLFSGYDEENQIYDKHTWHYQIESEEQWDTSKGGTYEWANHKLHPGVPEFTPLTFTKPKRDMTLQDPNCVYQLMKEHYSRYDMDTVCKICGMDKDILELVYKTYTESAAPGKAGTILYALGQTQHSYGGENCRAMSILQLLLGNVGIPGGGVNALRGEPNVQGATDMGMMVNEQPAYLKWANTTDRKSLRTWIESQTYSAGYYSNKPKFLVSALKEWFGDNATVDNDYGYDWWPKVPSEVGAQDYTHISTFELMDQGIMKGYFNWGMNPCHSAPNAGFVRRSMAKLDWLVVADQVETESACFWKAPDMNPEEIQTTVFFLPCALIYEKPGLINNSGRWTQWRQKAVEPWDEAKPDYEMCDLIWTKICELYKAEGGANPDPILNTKWDYYVDGKPDLRPVAWALNGYRVAGTDCNTTTSDPKADLLSGYSELAADGSTSCGMWIYGGYYNNSTSPLDPAEQPCSGRDNSDPTGLGLYPGWSFAWPNNRRILYNRCSADTKGKPWNPDKTLCEWTGSEWVLNDAADFVAYKTNADGTKTAVEPNSNTFFMTWEQNARLISYGMEDAALPEHYEPFESPLKENIMNGHLGNPVILNADSASTAHADCDEFPYVASTYSVTEHWQTGGQSRMCPALIESMPVQFIEISEELAGEKGIASGDMVHVWNNRGSVEIPAVVTKRLKPLTVNGNTVHEVGMTHHYSWAGVFGTDTNTVNDLTPNVGDPNSCIPEYKAFLVNIEKA